MVAQYLTPSKLIAWSRDWLEGRTLFVYSLSCAHSSSSSCSFSLHFVSSLISEIVTKTSTATSERERTGREASESTRRARMRARSRMCCMRARADKNRDRDVVMCKVLCGEIGADSRADGTDPFAKPVDPPCLQRSPARHTAPIRMSTVACPSIDSWLAVPEILLL